VFKPHAPDVVGIIVREPLLGRTETSNRRLPIGDFQTGNFQTGNFQTGNFQTGNFQTGNSQAEASQSRAPDITDVIAMEGMRGDLQVVLIYGPTHRFKCIYNGICI
jgi:hypothetical protein